MIFYPCRRQTLFCALAILWAGRAVAQSFLVEDIRVDGLQRVSAGTVFSYLPIKKNQWIDEQLTSQAITDLYASNLFSRVTIARDGNQLIVHVEEFPVIAEIQLSGNTAINTSQIKEVFSASGISEGQAYNPAMLQEMTRQLYEQYEARSKFQIHITPTVTQLPRGRVRIHFAIDEGRTAQIKSIQFVGNQRYSSDRLRKLLDTDTTGFWSRLTRDDLVNGERLNADLKRLEDFYFDRGFLDFEITSVQTALSQDKTKVFLTINLHEGKPYTLVDYRFSGDFSLTPEELSTLAPLKKDQVYNRSAVNEVLEAIKKRLADEGFARADVVALPEKNTLTQEVALNIAVTKGMRITVRHINFAGNQKSYDTVLRRELRQQESAPYSASDLERSQQRIRRLPQIEEIKQTLIPVDGHPDQVDVLFTLTERSTSHIQGGIGYGQRSGALLSIDYNDDNFLGSGNRFALNFTRSENYKSYGFDITDPYFTQSGVSANYRFNFSEYDYDKEHLSDWMADQLNATVTFGYPISEYQNIYLGGGYRRIKIATGDKVSPEITDFLQQHGKQFDEFVLTGAWTKNTLDDTYVPSTGASNSISAEVVLPSSDLKYYKITYDNKTYFSQNKPDSFIFDIHGKISYGAGYGGDYDALPFYRRYYAGGMSTVRGYSYGTLGPKYANGDAAGGDFLLSGGAEIMMPVSFNQRGRNFRVGLFVDGGYAWSDIKDFDRSDLRYSTGVFVQWLSPIGPLNMNYAVPLNKKDGDEEEKWQFTLGTAF